MPRRGFVLTAVLFAIVLLAALASGAFFAALQEVRIGRNAAAQVRARSAAESAIAEAMGSWDPRVLDALPAGGRARAAVGVVPGLVSSVEIRRLSDALFLLNGTASDSTYAEQTVWSVVRLVTPELLPASGVRARAVDAVVAARADGVDRAPPEWLCQQTGDTVPAVLLQSNAPDSAFFRFGPMDWPALAAWAQAVPPGGDSITVVYEPGDAVLAGGRILGVVVVEGDLVLQGGVEVVGLLLVRGTLAFEGSGGTVYGSVVASQVIANQLLTQSSSRLFYSSCAVARTAASRALPLPLPGLPQVTAF